MLRVLYVDDETGLLEIGKLFLEKIGQFTVDTIPSATRAIELLDTQGYDAIISDYQMPVMDGIAFLKAVRASGNETPFILFTGRGREEIVIQALNEGADFYLQKGGEPQSQFAELAHKVRQAVGRKRAERSLQDSEKRLADIINFLPDATFAIDADKRVIAWNRAIEEMTGVSSSEMMGKGDYEYALPFYNTRRKILIDLIFEPDRVIAEQYSRILHRKDLLIAETTLPHPKGRDVTLLGKASPLYDRSGKIVGAIESIRDITEIRRAEVSLRESEQRYREVVETQTEFICRFRPDGTLVFVNEAFCREFGKTRDEMVGHRSVPSIPKEDRERVRRHFAAFTPEHPEAEIEHRVIMTDGSIRWHWWNDHAIFDRNGRVIEYQSVGKDVTDKKHAEEAIRSSENLYRALFDFTLAATCILGPDTTILKVNASWEKLCGYTREEAESLLSWTVFIHRDDLERLKEYHVARRQDPDNAPRVYECRVVDKAGSIHYCLAYTDMIPETENSIASLVEITERKTAELELEKSENLYRSIFENTGAASIIIGPDTTILRANDGWEKLSGVPRQEQENRLSWTVFFAQDDLERMKAFHFTRRKDPVGVPNVYESSLIDAEGTIHNVIVHVGMIPGTENSVASLVDISERRRAEDDLRLAYENLTAAEEELRAQFDELKASEQKIRKSEEEYRRIIDNLQDAYLRVDEKGIVTNVSPSAARMYGYGSTREMVGLWAESLYTGGSTEREDTLRRLREAGGITDFYGRARRRDGTLFDVSLNLQFVRDENGEIAGTEAIVRDISERRKMEESLRKSEMECRTILENIQDVYYRTDAAGNLIFASPSLTGVLGYSPVSSLYGKNIAATLYARPDDRRAFTAAIDERGSVTNYEVELLRSDGSPVTVITSSHKYFDDDGAFLGIEGIFRDITERKNAEEALQESERRYRSVVHDQTDLIARITPDGIITFVNEAYRTYFATRLGIADVTGKTIREIMQVQNYDLVEQFLRSLTEEQPVGEIERTFTGRDGNPSWQVWSVRAIFNEHHDVAEY
jgi:PAS domain S-box-containing protein